MLIVDIRLLLFIVALKLIPADIDALRIQFNETPAVTINTNPT
jgi:hypothetical protein